MKIFFFIWKLRLQNPQWLFLDFEYKSLPHFWTSGTDLSEEGKFFFLTNGKTIGQMNWANSEPNNLKKQDSTETENCMAYSTSDNLKFYRLFDRFCSLKFYFVCQEALKRSSYLNSIPNYWLSFQKLLWSIVEKMLR